MARTETATIVPSPWNTCVTPTLRPMSPILMGFRSHLDFDVDASREAESHQGVDGLRAWIEDVDEPFVGPDLELLPAVLVDEGRAEDGELLDARWQRHRTDDVRAGPLGRLDDLSRRLIEQP